MITNYDNNINKFDLKQCTSLLCILYAEDVPDLHHKVEKWYGEVRKYYITPVSAKNLKGYLEKLRNEYFNNYQVSDKILQDIIDTYNSYLSFKNNRFSIIKRDNMVMTLLRSWEWPYYSDAEMKAMNLNLKNLIKAGEINLFDMKKCAYKEGLKENVLADLDYQDENIKEFCHNNGIEYVGKDKLLSAMNLLKSLIDNPGLFNKYTTNFSESFLNAIKQWRNIRKKLPKVFDRLKEELETGMKPESIMTKNSGSLWNSNIIFRNWMSQDYGVKKISNVIGNFYYGEDCILPRTYTKDLIKLPVNMNYYSLVCGKGDGFKMRYVGQPVTIYQNLLKPIADCFRKEMEYDEETGRGNPNISTFDQETRFKRLVIKSTDAFGIDYTGYSDYMSRNFLYWILEEIYCFPSWVMEYIKFIFEMPVKVDGELMKMIWGTLQGLMFDFHLITDANQVMWALACLISYFFDEAGFAGDDRYQLLTKGKYPEDFMNNQLYVAVSFNCVVNAGKTESWKRDGIITFCKISYDKNRLPVSGLSANSIQKHKPFLNDINSLFMQFIKTGLFDYIKDNYQEILSDILVLFRKDLEVMSKRYKIDLDDKILFSQTIPIEWGGLLNDEGDHQPLLYLKILEGVVNDFIYENKEKNDLNGWAWLFQLNDNKQWLCETDLGKFLISNVVTYQELREFINGIRSVEEEYNTYDRFNITKMRKLKKLFSKIVREMEYKTEVINISTKNRKSVADDGDKIYRNYNKFKDQELELTMVKGETHFDCWESLILRNLSIGNNIVDPLRAYLKYKKEFPEMSNRLIIYKGFGGEEYLGFLLEDRFPDPDNKGRRHIVRLQAWSESYLEGEEYIFHSIEDASKSEQVWIKTLYSMLGEEKLPNLVKDRVKYDKYISDYYKKTILPIKESTKNRLLENRRKKIRMTLEKRIFKD